jgi:hypothetical protein
VPSGFLGILQFEVTRLAVRPSASRRFNVFRADRAFWLQIQLIDDDQKFMGLSAQGSAGTTDVATMLEIANTRFEKRRGLMPSHCLGAVE